MKDDVPESFKTIAKENGINEAMRLAEGNIKHSDMYLTDEDRQLIKKNLMGEISKEEFIRIACEQAKKEAESMSK